MIVVLLSSSGAAWESAAFSAVNDHPGAVVLRRCVDVADLVAAASTGQADVAVVGTDLAGLDRTVVDDLHRHGLRVIGVAVDPDLTQPRAARIGITAVLPASRVGELGAFVTSLPADLTAPAGPDPRPGDEHGRRGEASDAADERLLPVTAPGRVITVWGPAGAPGRTLLAAAVAGELARRGRSTLLVDADPYGGAVAQQLGVLDEVSGLLAAARLVGNGMLAERFVTTQRRLSDHLRLLTGLPRADRWVELRPGALAAIAEQGRAAGNVVLDTGFSVEGDAGFDGSRPERNGLTREALEVADEVILVGAADPVGLSRLARAAGEVQEVTTQAQVRVVVNRMRPSLGWRERDVATMLAGFGAPEPIWFLPDDRGFVDRALVAGRLLVEVGESPLTAAIADLVGDIVSDPDDPRAHPAADASGGLAAATSPGRAGRARRLVRR